MPKVLIGRYLTDDQPLFCALRAGVLNTGAGALISGVGVLNSGAGVLNTGVGVLNYKGGCPE